MESEGDIRVLLVMDVVLSFVFSYAVIRVLEFADISTFSWANVAAATIFLAVVTYVAVLR